MGCGHFEIELDQSTPRSIVEELPTWSSVCVTPGRLDGMTRDDVLALSTFTGILRSRTNNLCTISGPSIMAWLGDEDGKGPHPSTVGITGATSAQDMISDLFTTLFGVYTNGITLGTYSSLPATPIYAAPLADNSESSRAFLDRICRFLNWQYRVTPAGVFDICDDRSLFVTTPTLVVIANALGTILSDVSYRVVAGTIRATAHDDDYATDVTVLDGTYSGQATVASFPDNFDSGATLNLALITKTIVASDLGSNANADAQAATELITNYATKNLIEITIDLDDPRAHVECGDSIYVCDPLQGLVLPGIVELDVMGQCLFPIEVDVTEMSWPVTDGMGVYVIHNTTEEVIDLSEYVRWGSGPTTLRVGARWPTLTEVVNGRN